MPQSFWESEEVEEPQPAQEQETLSVMESPEPEAESGNLALSVDDFSALEDRILRMVNLVKRERQARAEAEDRAAQAEARLLEQAPLAERLQKEVNALNAERDHVRQRVERLLAQLDSLEL